jgi:hypothetical protein
MYSTKSTLLACALMLLSVVTYAQNTKNIPQPTLRKCGFDEWFAEATQKYAGFREDVQQMEARLNQEVLRRKNNPSSTNPAARTGAIVTIPVVVHIIASNPTAITDADVNAQIAILNRDFSGLNPDSTNIQTGYPSGTAFPYSLRGHSEIRFCLANRDPNGQPTTGIQRRPCNVAATGGAGDPVKYFAAGGLDAWDPSKYYNMWICVAPGLLGYATFPTSFTGYTAPPAVEQGIVLSTDGFGPNPTPGFPPNRGRTAVHESGHFFALFHNFTGNCAGNDFSLLTFTGSGVDDTPNQNNPSSGCPTGLLATGCTPATTTGRNYQNYMDYTDDPCYSMFTVNQAIRMDAAVQFYPNRLSLTTSNGCTAPAPVANDAFVLSVVNPFGFNNYIGNYPCALQTNNYCGVNAISPTITVKNNGTAALTSVQVWTKIGAAAAVNNGTFTINIAAGATGTIALNPVTIPSGANQTLKIYTVNPNGVADARPVTDTVSALFSTAGASIFPVTENFEGSSFPPNGWDVKNYNAGSITWARWTTAGGFGGSTNSMRINTFNYGNRDHIDDFVSPNLDLAGADSIIISYDVAHARYDNTYNDSLGLVVSTDCGLTFNPIPGTAKGAAVLATAPATISNFVPTATQWRRERYNVSQYISNGKVNFGFRCYNDFGNNIYIDNINIEKKILPNIDIQPDQIIAPSNRACDNPVVPSVRVKNNGKLAITSFTLNYQINGTGAVTSVNWTGNLAARSGSTVVAMPGYTAPAGTSNFKVWTSNPNMMVDQDLTNDTANINVQLIPNVVLTPNTSFFEGFEGTAFPPTVTGSSALWERRNPDGLITWQRTITAARTGVASSTINNYNYDAFGRVDELLTPPIKYSGLDSIRFSYDWSASTRRYPGSTAIPLDTLDIFATKDCGATLIPLTRKYGQTLSTIPGDGINPPNFANFRPISNDQWKSDNWNLTGVLGTSGVVQFIFRNTVNFENNIYLDNINIKSEVLPTKLKSQGYMITPNPSNGLFSVRHFRLPTTLLGVEIYNAIGQRVWYKQFGSGNAPANIAVDISRLAAGVYEVRLNYSDKNIVERIIKGSY